MAQYKDIDEILKTLPDDLPYKASVKRVLIQAPMADVVPKSEVEKLKIEIEALKIANEKMYAANKAQAREIFEEIEKLSFRFMNDRHYIFGDMVYDIAELKKKYTEEKE